MYAKGNGNTTPEEHGIEVLWPKPTEDYNCHLQTGNIEVQRLQNDVEG